MTTNYLVGSDMYEIKINKEKNRIYLIFGTIENEAEMKEIVQTVRDECRKLEKGFTCLTDLRKYDPAKGIHDEYIRQSQEDLIKAGMSKVVRVRRPMGAMAHFQFNNISYEVGYHAPNVTSIEEGERLLDKESQNSDKTL